MVGVYSYSLTTLFINVLWPSCKPSKLPIAKDVGSLTSDGVNSEITINVQLCDFDGKFE